MNKEYTLLPWKYNYPPLAQPKRQENNHITYITYNHFEKERKKRRRNKLAYYSMHVWFMIPNSALMKNNISLGSGFVKMYVI